MVDYYLCSGMMIEASRDIRLSKNIPLFICDEEGRTSLDYRTNFVPQEKSLKNLKLEKLSFVQPTALEKLLEAYAPKKEGYVEEADWNYKRGDYVHFVDKYEGKRNFAILHPFVLESVAKISSKTVDTICKVLIEEESRVERQTNEATSKYSASLKELNQKMHDLWLLSSAELAGIRRMPSLLDVAARYVEPVKIEVCELEAVAGR